MKNGIMFLGTYRGKYVVVALTGVCALLIEIFYQYVLKSSASTATAFFMVFAGTMLITHLGDTDKERLAWRAATRVFLTCLIYSIVFLIVGNIAEAILLGELSADDPKNGSVQTLFSLPPVMFALTAGMYCLSTGGYLLLKKIGL